MEGEIIIFEQILEEKRILGQFWHLKKDLNPDSTFFFSDRCLNYIFLTWHVHLYK